MSSNDVNKLAEKYQKWYRTQNSFKVNKTTTVLIPVVGVVVLGIAVAVAIL